MIPNSLHCLPSLKTPRPHSPRSAGRLQTRCRRPSLPSVGLALRVGACGALWLIGRVGATNQDAKGRGASVREALSRRPLRTAPKIPKSAEALSRRRSLGIACKSAEAFDRRRSLQVLGLRGREAFDRRPHRSELLRAKRLGKRAGPQRHVSGVHQSASSLRTTTGKSKDATSHYPSLCEGTELERSEQRRRQCAAGNAPLRRAFGSSIERSEHLIVVRSHG